MNKEAYQLTLDHKVVDTRNFLVKSVGPNREQRRKETRNASKINTINFKDEFAVGPANLMKMAYPAKNLKEL